MIRQVIIVSIMCAMINLSIAKETNVSDNQTFFENYSAQDGVAHTDSGLYYKVIQKGDGSVSPTPTQTVTVHYEGKLPSGDVFDSSYKRGTPAKFGLNQVIAGWTEGLQLMHVGDVYELAIPSQLAYGPNGIPGVIPGNSPLIFKVELLDIQ